MTGFVMFLHASIAILLIVVILMQSGRGGGLTEGFASAESMFGAKTNEFMIKATTVLASVFLITCLSLAVLSSQRGKSLMADQELPAVQKETTEAVDAAVEEILGEEETVSEVIDEIPAEELPDDILPDDVPVVPAPETQ